MMFKTTLHILLKYMNAMKYKLLVLFTAAAIAIISCSKENQQIDYNIGILASQEYVQSQQMINLLLNTYFKSISDSLLIVDHESEIDGAIVTYTENPVEKIAINYPTWGGCDDNCGHIRAGKIEAEPSNGFYDTLSVIELNFNEFEYDYDDIIVNGMTITNLGRFDGVNYSFHIKATSIERVYADSSGLITFSMDQYFVLYKDASTIFHSPEDYFKVYGSMNGTTSTGDNYIASIDDHEYIIDQFSCKWAKKGPAILSFEEQAYGAFILFPGADTCLNRYAVDIDGNPFLYPFN